MPVLDLDPRPAVAIAPRVRRRRIPPGPFPARDLGMHRTLAFILGFTLPLLTLKTGYYGTPTDLGSRVALSDGVCILSLGLLFLRGAPVRIPGAGVLYLAALAVSLIPALLLWPGPEDFVWTTLAGITMAFSFYILGLNIGSSRAVTSGLLWGLALVTIAEFAIVGHDYFSSSQWFPDPMEGRARGTFKANGQLGAFGFCAAGLLLVLSRTPESPRLRTLCVVAGLMAGTFVFTASRRTGMICVFLWALAFAVLAARFVRRRFYQIFLAVFLLVLAGAALAWGALSQSFAGQRLSEGLSTLQKSDGFIRVQHEHILRTAGEWFPLGFGPGRGRLIDPADPESHEVHDGLLAVLVELGLAGFLGFVGLLLDPLLRRRRGPRTDDREIRDVLLRSFLLITFIFMFHNTLYRDRTFLLFLGMATSLVRTEGSRPELAQEGRP